MVILDVAEYASKVVLDPLPVSQHMDFTSQEELSEPAFTVRSNCKPALLEDLLGS